VTEVQDRNGRLAAVFLGHHSGTSVLAQARRANPHTLPSPAPPAMEKMRPELLVHTVFHETKGQFRPTILNLNHLALP